MQHKWDRGQFSRWDENCCWERTSVVQKHNKISKAKQPGVQGFHVFPWTGFSFSHTDVFFIHLSNTSDDRLGVLPGTAAETACRWSLQRFPWKYVLTTDSWRVWDSSSVSHSFSVLPSCQSLWQLPKSLFLNTSGSFLSGFFFLFGF